MDKKLDISVLIATYNRANVLEQTLKNMANLESGGLSVQFVVIDNNSTDNTSKVIKSFSDQLNVRHLFEPKAGKSQALNRALQTIDLGKIIVFTDDDVKPQKDWLKQIISICGRLPDFSVFGGKVDLIWPETEIPDWARLKSIQYWAFGLHYQGDDEHPYGLRQYPGGANYWVRREVFNKKRLFDEKVGPRPSNYNVMGTETSFLHHLAVDGYRIMYCPDVVLGHYVEPKMLSREAVKKRAYRWGRGMPHRGISRPGLFQKNRWAWRLLRAASLFRHIFRYLIAMLSFSNKRRFERYLDVITRTGYDMESLRISYGTRRKN